MKNILHYYGTIEVSLKTGPDIIDITDKLSSLVERSAIKNGMASAFMVGSTGSLTTIEHEPGVVADLKEAVNRLAPQDLSYQHELTWHDGNGHSHVQAALMGPSINLPVRAGELKLGAWQQVVAINHDNRPRKRNIEVTLFGTS
ncbi:MAG: YjbQ family protein [Desulfobacteraceae bacterium]|nr:YjbQ family protein [Desulfobacteraceae bacterium]